MSAARIAFALLLFASTGCDDPLGRQADEREYQRRLLERQLEEQKFENCHDMATLLATTSGSPDRQTCPNRFHRMRVQVASAPSKEEFGALVFCQCVDPAERDAGVN